MTRAALLLPCLFAAACTVGEFPDNPGTGGKDAGGDGGGSQSNGCVEKLAPPVQDAHQHAGGATNAGMNCQSDGCHGTAPTGPVFRFSGTVYEADGTTPAQGAVVLFDNGTKKVNIYTDSAGNFNVTADNAELPNPFTGGIVSATGCPTIKSMVGKVSEGGCTGMGTSCHGPGGGGGPIKM